MKKITLKHIEYLVNYYDMGELLSYFYIVEYTGYGNKIECNLHAENKFMKKITKSFKEKFTQNKQKYWICSFKNIRIVID